MTVLWQPIDSGGDLLRALGQWWGATVIPSLWWPGLLVVGYGLASWARRRRPPTSQWKPRAADRIHGSRAALVLGLAGVLCGAFVLIEPRWLLDVLFGGRAAPAAYEALTYTDTFRQRQAPWLLALILVNVPLYITVLVKGRWPAGLRRLETALSLVTCAVMAWTVLDGPVLLTPAGDGTAKLCLVLITAFTLVSLGLQRYRSIRPAPSRQMRAW